LFYTTRLWRGCGKNRTRSEPRRTGQVFSQTRDVLPDLAEDSSILTSRTRAYSRAGRNYGPGVDARTTEPLPRLSRMGAPADSRSFGRSPRMRHDAPERVRRGRLSGSEWKPGRSDFVHSPWLGRARHRPREPSVARRAFGREC
jgi:hypothetical protein